MREQLAPFPPVIEGLHEGAVYAHQRGPLQGGTLAPSVFLHFTDARWLFLALQKFLVPLNVALHNFVYSTIFLLKYGPAINRHVSGHV